MPADPAWMVVAVAAVAIVLVAGARWFLAEGRRQRGRGARAVLALGVLLGLAALGAQAAGAVPVAHTLYVAALAALVIGLVGLAGVLLFDLLLARFRVEVPSILRDLVQALAAAVLVAGVLRLAGLDPFSLVTTSAVITAVVGFALQNTIADVFGGLALQLDRTLGHGEWVGVSGHVGQILEIGWRSTRIVTKEGDTVFVPNSRLVSGEVVNFSRPTGAHRLMVSVGLAYRHPPAHVRQVLLDALRDVPDVLSHPPAECLVAAFGDSAITYELWFWTGNFARDREIAAAVRARLWYAVRRAGLEIPYPHQVEISEPPEDMFEGDAERRLALVRAVELFAPLSDPEREAVARGLRRQEFGMGEHILRQAEPADSLYVVESGRVSVQLAVDGTSREIAVVGPGQVLGEMSLMTGAPRQATCIALTDVVCYVLDREAFACAVGASPGLAERLCEILARRQEELDVEREGLSAAARARRLQERKARLLPRIQRFLWGT